MPEPIHRSISRFFPRPGRRRLWWGAAFLLIALGLVYLVLSPRLKLEAYLRQLARRGEKLAVSELVTPARADAVVAAHRFLGLAEQLPVPPPAESLGPPAAMIYVAPGLARVGWKLPRVALRFDPASTPGSTNSPTVHTWDSLEREISPHRTLLREIQRSLEAESFNWDLDYELGDRLLLVHLAPQKRVSQWLTATILNDLHAGRLDDAIDSLVAQVALADRLQHSLTALEQLIATSLASMAFVPTWEACAADGWQDSQLNRLQSAWGQLHFLEHLTRVMEMERAMGRVAYAQCRRDPGLAPRFTGGGLSPMFPSDTTVGALIEGLPFNGSGIVETIRLRRWSWRESYADEQSFLEQCQSELEILRGTGMVPSKLTLLETLEARRQSNPDSRQLLADLSFPARLALQKATLAEYLRSLAIAAIALKRFQLRHDGQYPESLHQLRPEFLPDLPLDPFDGQPLRYRREDPNQFVLYSVGADGLDDGGDPNPPPTQSHVSHFIFGRDIVWPWPSSTPEPDPAATSPEDLPASPDSTP